MTVATKVIPGPTAEVLPGQVIQYSDLIITVELFDSDRGVVDVTVEHAMFIWHGGLMAIPHPFTWDSDQTFDAVLVLAQMVTAHDPHSPYAARIAALKGEQNDQS